MASISSAGIGSGLDVASLVTKLMAAEQAPLTALDKKEASYQAKLSAFGSLKSSLAALQTAAKALSTPVQLAPTKVTVADTTVLNATTSTGAIAGNYNIEVQSLAGSQKLITATGFAATTAAVGTGVITLDFGSYSTASPPVFTANANKTTKTITIDSTNNTLAGIRDAINAANTGASASIINDGTKNYLSLTSSDTGAQNAMRISTTGTSSTDLGMLDYDPSIDPAVDPTATRSSQIVAAKDAVIIVDSVKITKPSNTITDAIEGVTLNLTNTTASGVTTKMALVNDTASVKTAIETFVKAYNDTNQAITDATAYNAATGTAAVLNGDSTVRSIQTQLRSLLGNPIVGATTGSTMLADVGITSQRDGTLAIDSAKLSSALTDTSKNLRSLFSTNGENKGYGALVDIAIGRILSPVGLLPGHTNSINSSISDIAKQRVTVNARLAVIEKRYRAQFTALDVAVASMTSTSNFLTQQLAQLAKNA